MTWHQTIARSSSMFVLPLLFLFGGPIMSPVHPGGSSSGAAAVEPRPQDEAPRDPTLALYGGPTLAADIPTTIQALAYAPGGAPLFAGDFSGRLHRIDLPDWRRRATFEVDAEKGAGGITALAMAPDSRAVAVGTARGPITLRDPGTGRELAALRQHRNPVTALAFSPDGQVLASASQSDGICLWDLPAGRLRTTLRGHAVRPSGHVSWISGLAFAPDGLTLASACYDKTVRLWDVATGDSRAVLAGPEAFYSIAVAPDGKSLAAGEGPFRASIRLWSLPEGREQGVLRAQEPSSQEVNGVAFLPDGKTLLSINPGGTRGQGRVRLWDLESGLELVTLPVPTTPTAMMLAPDGKAVAVGGYANDALFGSIDLIAIEGRGLRWREPVR